MPKKQIIPHYNESPDEPRYLGRRVDNLGANVDVWCNVTGNGSSTIDLCKTHAEKLDFDPHYYAGFLHSYGSGEPDGEDGWGGDVEHPPYNDSEYRCAIPGCGVLLGDE